MTTDCGAEWAYFAGFFDGEGCIMVRQLRPRRGGVGWELRLSVGQVDPAPLYAFQGAFGGGIYRRSKNTRTVWSWTQTGRAAHATLERLLPHLIVKRQQAILALELYKGIERKGRTPVSDEERLRREAIARGIFEEKHKTYPAPLVTGVIR